MIARMKLAPAALIVGLVVGASAARADGYPPFYGYSTYFGGPATYFTDDTDVQQVTKPLDGVFGFGTRTYYRGGPFWALHPSRVRTATRYSRSHHRHRRAALRVKG